MEQPRVLVVDDDPQVLPILEKVLSINGYTPEMFNSPFEALASVSAQDVGCVITDLEMPEMSGLELQEKLIEIGSCLSVIVISGHADVPRAIKAMGQGAITLIEKPFKPQQLITELRRAITHSQQSSERLARIRHAKQSIQSLTEDELEIMKCAAKGLPNKAISHELALSPRTVDRRRQSALTKLSVNSVAEFAVLLATADEGV